MTDVARAASLEVQVAAVARAIAAMGAGRRAPIVSGSRLSERILGWAMSHPSFKTDLFHFVDVFPAMSGDADVLRHLEEYFDDADVPPVVDLGLEIAERVPFGPQVAAAVARRNIRRLAHQFIVGTDPASAITGLSQLWRAGRAFTVDLLGEKTVTFGDADVYAARVDELLAALVESTPHWAPDDHLDRDDRGPLPRVNVSVKPTALAAKYHPLTAEAGLAEAKSRLRPVLRRALDHGALVNLDMEHYEVKDLTLRLFTELFSEEEFRRAEAGIVVQAYLKDSFEDLRALIAFSAARSTPITVRLVKGAYWDTETVIARAEGWPVPVFENKAHTDANYERCVRLLHDAHGGVRAAFGSHNLRSLAYAVAYARKRRIPDHGYEVQMLYGMAEPVQAAIARMGLRLRVYAPVGELVPGMAYLVRRLLENTSNESFVRRSLVVGEDLEDLLAPPDVDALPEPADEAPRRAPTDARRPGPYSPEPVAEWRRPWSTSRMAAAIEKVDAALGFDIPADIAGRQVETPGTIASVDPAEPAQLVARSARCRPEEAQAAFLAARRAWPAWRDTPAEERAAVLFAAGAWMRERREELAALEVFEAGKPWKEADADVCEAIDFCEYYGREMVRLAAGGRVDSPPGERNELRYSGRGVGVVIAPWNFPLAIPTGMVTAALVAGNAVLFKPAEQTPAVAAKLVDALRAGGLPEGLLAFLPGVGEEIGPYLVEHPETAFVAFTGSKAVGLNILASAGVHRRGQRHVKRVVAEMGGKNAIVVDVDADLDQAVPAIASSAFGYAGQKCSACSRLVVVEAVHDPTVDRLVEAAAQLAIGHPRHVGTELGPLIDEDAHRRVTGCAERAHEQGRVVLPGGALVGEEGRAGYFAGPTIVDDVAPDSALATEEIFGPVLAVLRAESFDHALTLANDTDYALTAGVMSRSPANIRQAIQRLRAGNVYVNRPITGAVVGRQPFGGYGLSGVGSKAGGPDYLLQFLEPRTITENTLRQGFAPSDGAGGV